MKKENIIAYTWITSTISAFVIGVVLYMCNII